MTTTIRTFGIPKQLAYVVLAIVVLAAVWVIGRSDALADPTEAKLVASDAGAGDQFGQAVDVDGDTAIVGAYGNDDLGSNSGSAYVFVESGGTWSQQGVRLVGNDTGYADFLGIDVALDGDTAVVGAYGDDNPGNPPGAAYVFVRTGTTWSQQAKLKPSDLAGEDLFGYSVAIAGDTAVVGTINGEAAYVFVRTGTTWSQQAKLTASDGTAGDGFGRPVAIVGDRVIVGSLRDDDGGTDSGSAYVFERTGSTWTQQAKLTAGDAAASDLFGVTVDLGEDRAIVGAHFDDDAGANSGSAYVFEYSGATWSQQAKLTAGDGAAGDQFGREVSINGDRAVIGARLDDDGGTDSGSAYVFTYGGAGWSQQLKLTASDAAAGDVFGHTGLDGATAIVGAVGNDDAGSGSGSAYVYVLNAAPEVTVPDDQTNDEGDTVSLPIAATDPDGDPLTYSATGLPDGLSINASTGLISGTLTFDSATTVTVAVSVSDGTLSTEVDFYWTVNNVNRAPIVTDPGDQVNSEGDGVSLAIEASDPDGDSLVYGAAGLPGGLSISPTSGEVSGTLAFDSAGSGTVTVSVSDGEAATEVSFLWTVDNVNRAPEVTSPGDQVNDEGDTVSLAIAASDPDGDTLTYSASGLPDGLSIDATTGEISGGLSFDASTVTTVTVSVSDGDITSQTSFLWTVNDVIIEFAGFDLSKLDVRFGDGPVDDRIIIHGSFTLGGGSDGFDLALEDVTVAVGTASIVILATSFEPRGNKQVFDGLIETEIVSMSLTASGPASFNFMMDVKNSNLTGTVNPMDVELRIGDDLGVLDLRLEGELHLKKSGPGG